MAVIKYISIFSLILASIIVIGPSECTFDFARDIARRQVLQILRFYPELSYMLQGQYGNNMYGNNQLNPSLPNNLNQLPINFNQLPNNMNQQLPSFNSLPVNPNYQGNLNNVVKKQT